MDENVVEHEGANREQGVSTRLWVSTHYLLGTELSDSDGGPGSLGK